MPYSNSTIFRTINADATTLTKSMGLLGKSFHDIKKDFSNGQGFRTSLFSTSISNSDFQSLQKFNSALNVTNDGLTKSQRISKAWSENMTGCSMAAKRAGNDIITGKKNIKDFSNEMQNSTRSTIGLTVAQTALNIAISMGLMAAISLAIKGFDKMINHAKRASEAADEAFEETSSKVQEQQEELKTLDELISKYRELKKDGTLDIEGRKEVKELQNDIADLVGTQARNLDLVNGKLDDEIEKLDEISAKEAKKAYETATANYNNSQRANQNAAGDDSYMFFDGYAYTGSREKDAEKILKEYGFGNNVSSGGFFGSTLFITDSFDNDMNALEGAQEKADYLQSMIDVLEQNGQRATELYSGLISQRDKYLGYIDSQQGAANSLVNSWITYSQYSNEELSNIAVNSVESFEAYRQKMIEAAKNDESVGKLLSDGTLSEKDLETAVNDFMATSTKFSDWYKQWIGDVQDTGKNTNKMTDSLSAVQKAADGIKVLQDAFKELSEDGHITLEGISEIKEAVGSSVDNWEEYEKVLMNAKIGSAEFNQAMSDLTYATLESKVGIKDLANADEAYVASLLRENGVLNANAVAHDAVRRAKALEKIESYDLKEITVDNVNDLLAEAMSCGVTKAEMLALVAAEIVFNNTGLSVEDKIASLNEVAKAAWGASVAINSVIGAKSSNADKVKYAEENGITINYGKGKHGASYTFQGVEYESIGDKDLQLAVSYANFNEQLENSKDRFGDIDFDIPNYSGSSSGGSGSSKKSSDQFKANIEARMDVLDRYKAHIDTLDFGLEFVDENDFQSQADLLSLKLEQVTAYGRALKEEFTRATEIIPQTGEEAEALASHLESLGGEMRNNVKTLREVKSAMEQTKIDFISTQSQDYLSEMTRELDSLEKRINLLRKDNKEEYKYTNRILQMDMFLPSRSDMNGRIRQQSAENREIIRSEQELQDILDDILRTQIEKNEDLREEERKNLLSNMEELQVTTQTKIDEVHTSYVTSLRENESETQGSCDTVANTIDSTDVEFPKPTIDFSDVDEAVRTSIEGFSEFDTVIDGLNTKASDLASNLGKIGAITGCTPTHTSGSSGGGKSGGPGFTSPQDAKQGIDGIPNESNLQERLAAYEKKIEDWMDMHAGTGDPLAPGFKIVSPYGYRIHPIHKDRRFHSGVDIDAPGGTPLYSVCSGMVSLSGWNGGYGNCLIIKDFTGHSWLYGHMAQPSPLKVGQRVVRGQTVGIVGSTGLSTGDHLHFERRTPDGRTTDPLPYLPNYEKGTPLGNKLAKNLGIAGENYKPEILVDKATGEYEYIDTPTFIDTSKTDVIGEKATARIPKFATGTIVNIPEEYGDLYTYMGWQKITAKGSNQYKLREAAGMKFDDEGYGKINGRYVVATTLTMGNVGDYIDIELADGNVLNAIIGDIKNQADAGANKYGHNNGRAVVEFVVDEESWYGKKNNPQLAKTTKITNTGENYFSNPNYDVVEESEQQKSINEKMGVFDTKYDEALRQSRLETFNIDSDKTLTDYRKAVKYYQNAEAYEASVLPLAEETYKLLANELNEYMNTEGYDQKDVDAYLKAMDEISGIIIDTEENTADMRSNVLGILEDDLSSIDDIISEKDFYSTWGESDKSKLDLIVEKIGSVKNAIDDGIISQSEAPKWIKELNREYYDATEEIMTKEIDSIEKRISDGDLYGWDRIRGTTDGELAAIRDELKVYTSYFKSGHLSKDRFNELSDALKDRAYSVGKDALYQAIELVISDEEEYVSRKKDKLNLRSSKLSATHTLLQSHYNIINSIRDAEHEISKDLQASMSMYEYLNKETRQLLFNQEDYNTLHKELNAIENKALKLQKEYQRAIRKANKEDIQKTTAEYQAQYETLMKSYEITKADLEVAKKKQQLNNVLKERNVRMFIDGEWKWVANTQNVQNAQNELADAEYALAKSKDSAFQSRELGALTLSQEKIASEINYLDSDMEEYRKKWEEIQKDINGRQSDLHDVLKHMATSDVPELQNILKSFGGEIAGLYKEITGEDLEIPEIYSHIKDYAAYIKNPYTSFEDAIKANKERNLKIDDMGLPYEKFSINDILELKKPSANELFGYKKYLPEYSTPVSSPWLLYSKREIAHDVARENTTIDNRIYMNNVSFDSDGEFNSGLRDKIMRNEYVT